MWFRSKPIWKLSEVTARSLRGINTKRSFTWNSKGSNAFVRSSILKKRSMATALLVTAVAAASSVKLSSRPLDNGPKVDMSKPAISPDEVAKHNSPDDCWVVIDGYVYDLTEFAPVHPGGPTVIKSNAGKDVSAIFDPLHAPDVIEKFIDPSKRLGPLEGDMPKELVCAPFTPGETPDDVQRKLKLRARLPPLDAITNLYDFEFLASQVLTKQAWAYYSSGADDEITMRENHFAYHRIFFKPKVLVNVAEVDTKTEMLGAPVDVPFYVTATALCKLGNPAEGEKDIARGCGSGEKKVPQMVSTLASCSLEEVVNAGKEDQIRWFQLYMNEDRSVVDQMISSAEKLGYKGIFVTVDAPGLGNREKDTKVKFSSQAGPLSVKKKEKEDKGKDNGESSGASKYLSKFIDPSFDWDDLVEVKKKTKLPIVIKGVQRVEDVVKAAEVGASGVVLSNHGGRQLDFSRSPIEVLAEAQPILKERNFENFDVFVDGGIRRGTDVVKALCLGAKGVGLGRPFLYANSVYGKEGVQKAIDILNFEVEMTMRLLGVTSIKQLGPELIDTSCIKSRSVQVPRDYLYDKTYMSSDLVSFMPPQEDEADGENE
ncbi:ZYRO0B13728p [Zygosaccharomyces rouxii]|uniref:L-lactate dehydrogenase (cytochrome) n=1 Tax=Zygosaccharomyces rouxii (strain ATCC 2623 / CBS 732 / NBRC 1130 / NCYC 568 / NRRL Y-229) TaxID=559307 RepID=C5DS44_ZYGRC|nr:uncharacterized protein ZYRO0B13728g [Zygosaccharomyces rouxii]KAH9199866.1 FMN-dependent dehydrogenase-domain-containing protein [Zygosaccharomyces rouxii]CAR26605.1 ZYRO0B13728p [Zygosaccharomyces rouxii]